MSETKSDEAVFRNNILGKRSQLRILQDILETVELNNPLRPTRIMQSCNMNYYQLRYWLDWLIKRKLIRTETKANIKRSHSLVYLTEHGKLLLTLLKGEELYNGTNGDMPHTSTKDVAGRYMMEKNEKYRKGFHSIRRAFDEITLYSRPEQQRESKERAYQRTITILEDLGF